MPGLALSATAKSLLTTGVVATLVLSGAIAAAPLAAAATPHAGTTTTSGTHDPDRYAQHPSSHRATQPGRSAARVRRPSVTSTAHVEFLPAVSAAADSSLSALVVNNAPAVSSLAPAFATGTHDYQVIESDGATADVTPTATQGGATFVVKTGGVTNTLTNGVATVPLVRGRNDVTVTVTSSNNASTTVYRISVWRYAAPKAQIVNVADATSTVLGGTYMTVTMKYGELPSDCDHAYYVGDHFAGSRDSVFDPATGLTRVTLEVPRRDGSYTAGKEDLGVNTECTYQGGGVVFAYSILPNAVTYLATIHVTSIDVPNAVSSGTPMTIHGFGITEYSYVYHWLTDSTGTISDIDDWDFTGNDNEVVYADYAYGDPFYATSRPLTLHVGYCPYDYDGNPNSTCTSVYSKTINWVAPVPTQLSFSPSSGPQSGGTVVRLRGRYIVSGTSNLVVKVGGQDASYSTINQADDSSDQSFAMYTSGQDIVDITVPPSATVGPVPISVTNDFGTTVAAGSFTYSAQPTIASISPSAVANTGGSVVTVTGTAFGAAGTPTVIIDGNRSPLVRRISATKLTAVVPASSTTGAVSVTVSSSQGGGISAAGSLTLRAPGTAPTITSVSPGSGQATDDVTITGTDFGPSGTVGVSVDGQWALVTSSTATKINFQVPATDTAGSKTLVVGTVTGSRTKAHGFTVIGDPGINAVSPTAIVSYATGNAAKIAVDGYGFGSAGSIKVGSAAAKSYTATAGGTHIAGVVVPTNTAGSLPVVVTPSGAKTALRSSVFVTAPAFTYVGPDPYQATYGPPDLDTGIGGVIAPVPATGATPMRLEGSGFGTSGTLKVGSTTVQTTGWSDTLITFIAPAHAVGTVAVVVTPLHSTLSATRTAGIQYTPATVGNPTFTAVTSVQDNSYASRSDFNPVTDTSNLFTVTGSNLAGTTAADTQVIVSDFSQTFTIVPTAVTATSLTFAAPRSFTTAGWKTLEIDTDSGLVADSSAILYLNAGVQITVSPTSGYCGKTSTSASGSVTYTPTTISVANTGQRFGGNGTATLDGVSVTPTHYSTGSVIFSTSSLATALSQPWGTKTITITPNSVNLRPQTVNFTCAVTPSVTTTANSSNNALTVAAGTPYTMGYSTTGFVGSFSATAPSGYEYVTADDFNNTGFTANVHSGVPTAAGDYYVRVSLARATYDPTPYLAFTPAPVHVTITGTPITITPVSNNGAAFTYKGQLGDGTGGTSNDFHYTASSSSDPITGVTWEYRDSVCEGGSASQGWTDGLPKNVARSSTACGGNGTTLSHWDVRVKTFQMSTSGTDRSVYYQATTPYTQITINPRTIAINTVRADKVYDGTTDATFGSLTFTGAIDGDDLSLDNQTTGSFATAAPGVNKPVTLSGALALAGADAGNYTLSNTQPPIVGTISKASAVLSLAASTTTVLLSQSTSVTITPTVSDSRTSQPVAGGANVAAVVLVSQTPSICTISGTTVTATHAGVCTIAGTEAASVNYNAATAASDPTSHTETIDIHVFPSPQAIQVVADDDTVAVGDTVDPTSEFSGLFDGDSISGVQYRYYSGSTLLQSVPTTPGIYRIVPYGGTLTAANNAVYSNPTSFHYVASTLVITAQPPTITTITPQLGSTAGGTLVTIVGTRLDTVRSITIGAVTLRTGQFSVNLAGTALTFRTPKVSHGQTVDLTLTAGTATAADVYTYVAPTVHVPTVPRSESAAGANGSVTVTFTPPASNGGAPITSYQVSTDGGHTWHTVTTHAGPHGTLTATVTGLANGHRYAVQVRAVNRAGAGPASAARNVTPMPSIHSPGMPTHLTAAGHNRKIDLRFTPPASDGGAHITSYQVSLDGGRTWHRIATHNGGHGTRTATVRGPQNGVVYRVRVRAVNSHGAGTRSHQRRVVPNTAPLGNVRHHPASEVAIPKHPNAYHGKQVHTRAFDTSHNGTWAHEIPDLGARQMTVGEAATLSKSSLFEFDSAKLTKDGRAEVRALARHLRLAHGVTCEGYTDYAGRESHEKTLSAQRALAVCKGLQHYGAHVTIVTHGYGGARPVVVGGTPESRAGNRRVVVIVTS